MTDILMKRIYNMFLFINKNKTRTSSEGKTTNVISDTVYSYRPKLKSN